jgi:hypothetical protein
MLNQIQTGLIDRNGFYDRGECPQNLEYLPRDFNILHHVGAKIDGIRATPVGLGKGHGGVDPEGPGPVVGRGDHASMTRQGPEDHRAIAVIGAVAFRDAGTDRVEIDMADPA